MRRQGASLASLDLNLIQVLRELLRERNVTRAAERVEGTRRAAVFHGTRFDPASTRREFTLIMADCTCAYLGEE